jgi:HEAT repeats
MRPSAKIGPAILSLFALPFLLAGLMILLGILRVNNFTFKGDATGGAILAGALLFVGGIILVGVFKGYSRLKEQAALQEANPTWPWLWRQDWANRKAESSNKNSEILYWVLCIFCNGISIPVILAVLPQLTRGFKPPMFAALAFGLLGGGLLIQAVRVSLRQRRFGKTYFELNTLPFTPGERLSGRIQLKMDVPAERGIDLRLVCVRKIVTNAGENSTTSEIILWEGDQNVSAGSLSPGPLGRTIPVDFAIPSDAYVTNQDDHRDQVIWRLYANAELPGIDYKDSFEIPVFKTSATGARREGFDTSSFSSSESSGFSSTDSAQADTGAVAKPAKVKVQVFPGAGGTQFYFRAFRNPTAAIFLAGFTALWTGVVYFLFHSKAPVFFPIVFGFFDLLLILAALHSILGSSRIVVGNGSIVSRGGILGIGKTRSVRATDVDSIVPVASIQQGNTSGNTVYEIRLRTKDGRKIRLADGIDSRQEARWIVSQIETLCGLKIDTHVETDARFGAPPQPGMPSNPQDWPMRGRMMAGRQNNSYVPVIVFFAVACAMFAFLITRQNAFRARANGVARNRANNAARPNPRPKRNLALPMTDADETRIRQLQPQAQAEELMERAILHDDRALEIFEQNIDGWTGKLDETENLKNLERRSEFSKDLRVRNANADLNLALQGWSKTEELAEQTIQQAQTDKEHRAWALYYLGMLGGRGVDYDHIHTALVKYAKNDPDPNVRQWAVEGMRYLGKDEALDDLFDSFAHDPAMTVRDRAGCNVSDCGNFTRKQRMRMAPQLIDLAANSSTNGQVKSWCFTALREITDANVPNDADAWRNWYASNGPAKMAEFEKMDWWNVRGDE